MVDVLAVAEDQVVVVALVGRRLTYTDLILVVFVVNHKVAALIPRRVTMTGNRAASTRQRIYLHRHRLPSTPFVALLGLEEPSVQGVNFFLFSLKSLSMFPGSLLLVLAKKASNSFLVHP